jgi:hypothetical protein
VRFNFSKKPGFLITEMGKRMGGGDHRLSKSFAAARFER